MCDKPELMNESEREGRYMLTAALPVWWGARPRWKQMTSIMGTHEQYDINNGRQIAKLHNSNFNEQPLMHYSGYQEWQGPTQVHNNEVHRYDIRAINETRTELEYTPSYD